MAANGNPNHGLSEMTAWRFLHTALGIGFSLFGVVLIVGFSLILLRSGEPIGLFGMLTGVVGVTVGTFMLSALAYHVKIEETGLLLHFVFRSEVVPWTSVLSYKKSGVTWGSAVDERHLNASTFVTLRYRSPGGRHRVLKRYFWLSGRCDAFQKDPDALTTPLDIYVPTKRISRGKQFGCYVL